MLACARLDWLNGLVNPRSLFSLLATTGSLLLLSAPVSAQDEVQPPQFMQTPTSNALQLAQAAAARGDAAEALSRYLRILATTPDNVTALVGAGRAALDVGDTNAAAGFLSRADVLDSRNGQVKAGLAATMLANGNARAALRLFNEAINLGVPLAEVAADRGLAYDLRGAPKRAQADYALALRTHPSDETTRRLALSQAIAGDRVAALATLDPLLRKQSIPAWRARIFVYALTGDVASAQRDAPLILPRNQVVALAPYLPRLATLKTADKAAAVHLGRFPGETQSPPKPVEVNAPRIPVDRATLAPPAPVQSFEDVKAAAASSGAYSSRPPASVPPSPASTASSRAPVPAVPSRAELAAQAKLDAQTRAAEKRKAEAAAAAKAKRAEEEEARAAARKNPARHWVQVAGGANKNDLPREWAKLKAKWPALLGDKTPWTTSYRFTNRLMIGPFPTSAAAQEWVTRSKKEGFPTFRVETANGDPVERVN